MQVDDDGFINTYDRVEVTGDRVHFRGRENGSINIGGVKVFPEEVERLINTIDGVALCHIEAKKNPIVGALLVATVVPCESVADHSILKREIIARCNERLPREAVPSSVKMAQSLAIRESGKLARN
jgi:acyl-coenzyme A synthetase/AMP-(fatty) acid ligase